MTELVTLGRNACPRTDVIEQRDYRKRRQINTQEPIALTGLHTTLA